MELIALPLKHGLPIITPVSKVRKLILELEQHRWDIMRLAKVI